MNIYFSFSNLHNAVFIPVFLMLWMSSTASASDADVFKVYQGQFDSYFTNAQKEYETVFNAYRDAYDQAYNEYLGKISKNWDAEVVSTSKVWVTYEEDFNRRSMVDFENNRLIFQEIESANGTSTLESQLKEMMTKTFNEAYEEDFIAQKVEAKLQEQPQLKEQLIETKPPKTSVIAPYVAGKSKLSVSEVDTLAVELSKKAKKIVKKDKKGKKVVTYIVPIDDKKVKNRKAKQFLASVKKFSSQEKISSALILAVMETESAFNPMAKSHIPAYGLMQIVPESAGKDATQYLFGKQKLLSPSYLFTPEKNIEIGAAYLHILNYRYLKAITDPQSRLYCTIAAYNTGAGNVARAFIGSRLIRKAAAKINTMSSDQVYRHLINYLPHRETRLYLKKVNDRFLKYRNEVAGVASDYKNS